MRTSSAARQFVTRPPLGAMLIVLLPALAAAQEPVRSFDQLNTRLRVGDRVSVTDTQGREVTGKISELHDASITLDGDAQTVLNAEKVRLVERRTKSVGKAALWGLLIGGAAGAAAGAVDSSCSTGDCMSGPGVGFLFGAGFGAGIGAAMRAVLPAGRKEVYRAPGASGSARLSLAPVITPRTKGVALSYSF
jgi:hypothetical protein